MDLKMDLKPGYLLDAIASPSTYPCKSVGQTDGTEREFSLTPVVTGQSVIVSDWRYWFSSI